MFTYVCDKRTGDISLLDTHAVVSCNNENFSDSDPQTTMLLDRAGPELRQELANSVRGSFSGSDVKRRLTVLK